jgi:hypothetical protein
MPDRQQWFRGTVRRGGVEFFIIVAGILAALAVDEWREQRQEQRILDEYLADLASEVDGNLASLEIIRGGALRRKIEGLQAVIRFCQSDDIDVEDPEAFLASLARSADAAAPWFVTHRFEALQNSGSLRLVRDPEIISSIAAAYEAPNVLFTQVEGFSGDYRPFVNELIPARYQVQLNHLAGYVSPDRQAPGIDDGQNPARALRAIHAQREKLLALARNEAAVATAQWYAFARIEGQMNFLLNVLAEQGYDSTSSIADQMRNAAGSE